MRASGGRAWAWERGGEGEGECDNTRPLTFSTPQFPADPHAGRSLACELIAEMGYTAVRRIDGGIDAYLKVSPLTEDDLKPEWRLVGQQVCFVLCGGGASCAPCVALYSAVAPPPPPSPMHAAALPPIYFFCSSFFTVSFFIPSASPTFYFHSSAPVRSHPPLTQSLAPLSPSPALTHAPLPPPPPKKTSLLSRRSALTGKVGIKYGYNDGKNDDGTPDDSS